MLAVHSDGIDAVLDVVSDTPAAEHLAQLLRPGGTYVSTTWSVNPDAMEARQLRGVNYDGEPSAALLDRLSDLIDAGELRVRVEREVPFAEAADALATTGRLARAARPSSASDRDDVDTSRRVCPSI